VHTGLLEVKELNFRSMETSQSRILLSVIICTHRRPQSFEYLLESLEKQDWNEGGWEVIAVENDEVHSGETEAVAEKFTSELPLRYRFDQKPNLSSARNIGARMAVGKYLAYLDDDAMATSGWLKAVMKGCREYEPDFCGGPILPIFRVERPYWYRIEYEQRYHYSEVSVILDAGKRLSGGNFIVRRELLLNYGGFSEDLGMRGAKIAYGEETHLLVQAWENNPSLKVMYFPDAAVNHEVRPIKLTILWNLKNAWASGRDSFDAIREKTGILRNTKIIVASFIHLLLALPGLFGTLFFDVFRPQKTLWRRYVMDKMHARVHLFSKGIVGVKRSVFSPR
jgi:glucosyl-dolichyl phosphate glucuronosyltransferase